MTAKKICSHCKYKRFVYSYNIKKEPLCKICSIERYRQCKVCSINIPAGSGNFCKNCSSMNAIRNKLKANKANLTYTKDLFKEFCFWLAEYRDPHFSSINLYRFLEHFTLIDKLYINQKKFPSYRDIIFEYIKQNKTYSNILFKFLLGKGLIIQNYLDKKDYQNIKTINKYINKHKDCSSELSSVFLDYYHYLLNKFKSITLSSIKLALTPANKLIETHIFFNLKEYNEKAISSFLLIYPGYKASITEFINYLFERKLVSHKMSKLPKALITKTTKSKTYLRIQLISLLRKDLLSSKQKLQLIILCLAYFHKIDLPKYSYIT